MRKFKKTMAVLSMLSLAALGAGIFVACGEKEYVSDDIINGSFEYDVDGNTIPGWIREDMAFQAQGVTEEQAVELEAAGNSYFNGKKAIITNRGTLTSLPFLLSGTGKIAFKLGAAKNPDKVYVEFLEQPSGRPLTFLLDGKQTTKATNTDFDGAFITAQLIRHTADLSAHLGKTIVIRITDNDAGKNEAHYPYANLDDFRLLKDQTEVKKYEDERQALLAKYAAPPFDDDTPEAYTIKNGDFDQGLDQWKITGEAFRPANVAQSDAIYWESRYFYAHGDKFFRGDLNEGSTGSMRSTTFTLKPGAPYLTMMLGAAKSANVCVEVRLAEDVENEKKDAVVKVVRNNAFSDPTRALTLVRTYVKLEEKYEGKKLYLNVVDNETSNFGFINLDDVRCSLTEAEVTALITEQFRSLDGAPVPSGQYANDVENLRNWYLNCEYPAPANFIRLDKQAEDRVLLDSTLTSPVDLVDFITAGNEGAKATLAGNPIPVRITEVRKDGSVLAGADYSRFTFGLGVYNVQYVTEADENTALNRNISATVTIVVSDNLNQVYNGGFETGDMTGWTPLTEGFNKDTCVISDASYWGEKIPYNQSGKYHLDGWNTGIDEQRTWGVKSTNFILGGSGWISVKMGGRTAAVKVFKADGTQIGLYRANHFKDDGFPDVTKGSWADMRTYAIDLSEYVGETLYLELWDVEEGGGWGLAFFDEVVTYYETAPDWEHLEDTVANSLELGTANLPWRKAENSYSA